MSYIKAENELLSCRRKAFREFSEISDLPKRKTLKASEDTSEQDTCGSV